MYEIDTRGKRTGFRFAVDGVEYEVPTLDEVSLETADEIGRLERAKDISAWLRSEMFEKPAPGCLDRLTLGQWNGLMEAYIEASRVEPGE